MAYISCKTFFISTLFLSLFSLVNSVKYEVGEDKGWIMPASKNDQFYNQWASQKRFLVNDTIEFKYEKDSVLVVTDSEYQKCHSPHPMFFSNSGDTVFTLDRPGLFYFISGATGHCERGEKMIIKVLDIESPAPSSSDATIPPPSPSANSAAVPMITSYSVFYLVMSFLGFLFIQS